VRFRPPLDWTTIMLWFGPALLLLAGFAVLFSQLRHRRTLAAARAMPELSDAERAALAALAAEGGGQADARRAPDATRRTDPGKDQPEGTRPR
jgi:cytochrome c-type biogenesis protein CcmH